MRELYEKYLESEDVVLYDTFRQYIEKLPIEDWNEFKERVEFSGGDYVSDAMDAAIGINWLTSEYVYPDDLSIELELDYMSDAEVSDMMELRIAFERLEDKGWTIENKKDLIEELTQYIEEAKVVDYRVKCHEFIRKMSEEEVKDFCNRFIL